MPVVTMHDIEGAEELLYGAETIIKGITHPVHLSQYISGALCIYSLVMDAIDLIVGIKVTSASQNMYFMTPPSQCFGEF